LLNTLVVGSPDRQLEEALRAAGMNTSPLAESSLASLVPAAAAQPDVIVLDLRGKTSVPAAVGPIRRQHPATGIVIVSSSLDPALLLEAMRAGVNEIVSEPCSPADLEAAIIRVVGQRPMAEVGQVFGFVGAKGGVGTTTVAVNVATALGAVGRPERTLLIDLHQAGGDAGVFLGAEPRFTIVDALQNTHRLDQTFFRSLVSRVAPELDLLSAADLAIAAHPEPARVRRLLEFVATLYKYTVVDLPRSDGPVMDALDHLSALVIVTSQELAAVKSAGRLASVLRHRYGRNRVSLVLSRSDKKADIAREDVERAVGSEIAFSFPSDYRQALQALNKGRPLALDGETDLAGAFKRYAFELAGVSPDRKAPRPGLLGRLSLRRV
jgi:pilus assembly protein CpaE